ncbi:MAG: MerC domain-containing protein [Candidatus Kapaibacterium sp.]
MMNTNTLSRHRRFLDRLGVSASTLCAIHCVAMPLLLSTLPAIGLGFLAHGTFELVMIAVSITIAAISLGGSYKLHRRLNALMMMASGGMLLVFNFFGHESHAPLIETLHPYIAGFAGLMIASAHWINMRLCTSCERCEHDHAHDHAHDHQHGEACDHSPRKHSEAEIEA